MSKTKTIVQISVLYVLYLLFCVIDWSRLYWFYDISVLVFLLQLLHRWDYIPAIILFTIIIIRVIYKHTFRESGFCEWSKETLIVVGLNILYMTLLVLYNVFIGNSQWALPLTYIAIGNILLVGIAEESVFRGFITNKLSGFVSDKRSLVVVVLISALLFSLMHVPSTIANSHTANIDWFQLFYTFLFGIWTAVYYFYKRNLIVCIITHGVGNAIMPSAFGAALYVFYGVYIAAMLLYIAHVIFKSETDSNAQYGRLMKRAAILILSAVIISAVAMTAFILTKTDTEPVYGRFTHINDDGSVAAVTLTETTIFCENLVYDEINIYAAGRMALDYFEENNLPWERDDFETMRQSFLDDIDLASVFENREVPITESFYNEGMNEYYYYYRARNPEDGSPGLFLRVNVVTMELELEDMVFSYIQG